MSSAEIFLPQFEQKRINQIFDELGPTPRLCIDYLSNPGRLKEYRRDLRDAILDITSGQLEKLIRDIASVNLSEVSHKLFLIFREEREVVNGDVIVVPITEDVKKKLALQFRNLQKDEQIRLYEHFAKVPDSRAVAGIFFEAACQRRLQEGTVLELIRMVKLDTDRKGKESDSANKEAMPHWWHSSLMPLSNALLEGLRQAALTKGISIHVQPSQTLEFTAGDLLLVKSGIFYVPQATMSHEALDSFFLLGDSPIYDQYEPQCETWAHQVP
jgi:hypothetical protein